MANRESNLDLISVNQSQKEVTANELFNAASPAMLYGRRASLSTGLTFGYYGGNIVTSSGSVVAVENGTVELTAESTNYIVAKKSDGEVSASTSDTDWNSSDYWRLYLCETGALTVTDYTDYRIIGEMTSVAGGGGGMSYIDADVTVEVGTGGDYATINEAIDFLSRKYPIYTNNGFTAEIRLLSGFVLEEQVLIRGLDLGWITITAEDALVDIDATALTETLFGSSKTPAFGVVNGVFPNMPVKYRMVGTRPGGGSTKTGFVALYSRANLSDGGIQDAWDYGADIRFSRVIAQNANFDGCYNGCVYVAAGCVFEGQNLQANNCSNATTGAIVIVTSFASILQADANNSSNHGVYITNSDVMFTDGQAQNAGGSGVRVVGSRANLTSSNFSGAVTYGVELVNGSSVSVGAVTGTLNVTLNTPSSAGIAFG